jgi:hypothetical protein
MYAGQHEVPVCTRWQRLQKPSSIRFRVTGSEKSPHQLSYSSTHLLILHTSTHVRSYLMLAER